MNKIQKIIRDNFDLRADAMVIGYIIDKGWDFCSSITEEEIEKLDGNPMMSQRFIQSLVRAAGIIVKECSMMDDFVPYIAERFHNDAEDFPDDEFDEDK